MENNAFFYEYFEHIRKRCISGAGATIILCRVCWDHTHYTRDTQCFWKYWLFHWFYKQTSMSKKQVKNINLWTRIWPLEASLGTPYFRVMGGPKCSWYNEIVIFLTIGHFWEKLGRHRMLTVFWPILTKTKHDFRETMRWIWWKTQRFFNYFKNYTLYISGMLEVKKTQFWPHFGHPEASKVV